MGAHFLLACEEVDARRASGGQTEEFLADGYTAQQNSLPFAAPDGAAKVLPRKRGRESVSSSRSEEVDARRVSAGQTEEFLADGYTAQQNVLPFAALFVSPCLGVRLV